MNSNYYNIRNANIDVIDHDNQFQCDGCDEWHITWPEVRTYTMLIKKKDHHSRRMTIAYLPKRVYCKQCRAVLKKSNLPRYKSASEIIRQGYIVAQAYLNPIEEQEESV